MGVYYNYAIVHDRVLIWWTDNYGFTHSTWIEGIDAEQFFRRLDKFDSEIQSELARLSKIRD